MRAIAMRGYGGPEVLDVIELEDPRPSSGETLVRVRAVGVNPADGKWRRGMFESFAKLAFPHVPGYDVAGTVVSGGGLAPGTAVLAMLDAYRQGAYAELVTVPDAALAEMPAGMDFALAAALPTPGLTGIQLVERAIDARRGERLLITGAVGAVGRFAMFAARARGVIVVAAVRASQRDAALAAGADEVVEIGNDECRGAPVDHVADTVGGEGVARLCRQLRPGGRIVTVATIPIPADGLPTAPTFYAVEPDTTGALGRLARSAASGAIGIPIARILPLAEAAEAQRLVDRGGAGGRIILLP